MTTRKRVLIVEDEAIVAMSLSRTLPRLGYEICGVVASGEEALLRVDTDQPDVLLMDIHLLGTLDGVQTAELIRTRCNVPIVFMSGYDINEIQEKTKHIPNASHVGKPVGMAVLAGIIQNSLENSTT
jgi:CheY-like chemotaxis protein